MASQSRSFFVTSVRKSQEQKDGEKEMPTRRDATTEVALLTRSTSLGTRTPMVVPAPNRLVIVAAKSKAGLPSGPRNAQAGVNVLSSASTNAPSISPLAFAWLMDLVAREPEDERTAIQGALAFLSRQQDQAGSIGGFYTSAWSLMAINKLPSGWFSEFSQLEGILDGLLEYNSARAQAFLDGDEQKQLNSTSQTTEGNRLLWADPHNHLGDGLKYAVWEKALRLSGQKRAMNDTNTVWRAFMILLMQREGWTANPLYERLIADLRSFQKPDGGWSEGGYTVGHIDHSAAVMAALQKVEPKFFEGRRDQETGGFRGPGDALSVETTSWAIMALGQDRRGHEFLRKCLQADGSIAAFQTENPDAKIWPTALALSALSGPGF